ncbi:hypothetical protein PC120_g20206 [Phytophthora cactorum]|nr:hypothetical protein PC120_g20206 [Phytophthora cactorum]
MTISDSSRRQTRVNAGAPLKERTRGQIDASAGTTKQGEATVVNDLTLSAGSVITVAEASCHVRPAVGGTTQPTTATGDASCASRFMMRGSSNCTDTSKASSMEARSIFTFVAGSEWPDEDLVNRQTTENGDYYDGSFADGEGNENDRPGPGDGFSEASIDSAVSVERLLPKKAPKVVRLREGESLGWWSSQRYDQRVRMRAMVGGAVNDEQTTILLDTDANVSIIWERFVKKLRLRAVPNHGRSIDVQGIGKGTLTTKRRVLVKVTLEGRLEYELEMWVLPHNAGVDVVLGMDFMIPAGVRLDLYRSTAMLPGETTLTLLKSKKMEATPVGHREVPCRSPRGLRVEAHGCADFSLQKNRPPAETHAL